MKKLCVMLALILLVSAAALAETPATPIHECGDYTYVVLADGTAQIVAWLGDQPALHVPATLDGLTVTSISECAFADCVGLQSVALPETVAEIGQEAFGGCLDLETIALPEGLTRIGDFAFKGCEGLTAIALPDSVEAIGENPFLGCANLYDIFVSPESAYLATINGVLFSKPDRRLVSYPMGLTAESYAVPEGVRAIGAMAFDQELYLEEITLPKSLEAIGQRAFNGCDGLLAMNLPAGVTSIGEGAMLCRNLTLTLESEDGTAQYAQADGFAGEA